MTRRDFLPTSAGLAAAATLLPHLSQGQAPLDKQLKIGLVGCGGRGSGALMQAMTADVNTVFWAAADAYDGQIKNTVKGTANRFKDRVQVPAERQFTGLTGYKQLFASGIDVVLLCTSPGFRSRMLKEAIEAGLHVFCEKPAATDANGLRQVIAATKLAKEKNLNIQSGFNWRHMDSLRAAYADLHGGDSLGKVMAGWGTWISGIVKPMPPAETRPPGIGDQDWQVRNWYNFTWTCGDSYVEQAIHNVNKLLWTFNDELPEYVVSVGGRSVPSPGGNIFDHFQCNYFWKDGRYGTIVSRHWDNCHGDVSDRIFTTKGIIRVDGNGAQVKFHDGTKKNYGQTNDPYQIEHNELFAALRSGKTVNHGEMLANSTLMAIMGRMAAYTGQKVTPQQALESEVHLVPDVWDLAAKHEVHSWYVPGKDKTV